MASDDDFEGLARLRWQWGREAAPLDDADPAAFVTAAVAWAAAHRDTHIPHAAVNDTGSIIGMAWLALTPRVPSARAIARWSGDLQSCFVVPELRGAGIGGKLVRAVLETAAARGVEHVTVHASRESARMYARHGFRENERLLWADVEGASRE